MTSIFRRRFAPLPEFVLSVVAMDFVRTPSPDQSTH